MFYGFCFPFFFSFLLQFKVLYLIHIARRRKLNVDGTVTDGFKIVQEVLQAKGGLEQEKGGTKKLLWKQIFALVYSVPSLAKFFKHKFDIKIHY